MKFILVGVVLLSVICGFFTSAKSAERAHRIKRQNAGDQLIDAVFQVPIQTLTAVGTLVKSTRPVVMAVRQQVQQQLQQQLSFTPQRFSFGSQQSRPQANRNRRLSVVAGDRRRPTASFNRLPGYN